MQMISNPPLVLPLPTQIPSGRMYLNVNQSVAGGGIYVQILLDAISPNFTDGIEDTVNHQIAPGVAGWYQVNASIKIDHPNIIDNLIAVHVLRNPGGNLIMQCDGHVSNTSNMSVNISDIVYLTELQNLEMGVVHWDAANDTVVGQSYATFLSVQRVR